MVGGLAAYRRPNPWHPRPVTWQAVPLRAAVLLDCTLPDATDIVRRVDVWQRAAAAVGLRLTAPPGHRLWQPAQVNLGRVGRASSNTADVQLVDGLPVLTVTAGPARLGRLRLQADETGAGVLVTAEFGNPELGSGTVDRLQGTVQSRYRRDVVRALETLVGMFALELRQTRIVVAGAVLRDGSVLAAQRRGPAPLAGRWEFPGGKVRPGEQPDAALRRELGEELGVDVVVGDRIGPEISLDVEVVLRLYAVSLTGQGDPLALEHSALRWLRADELDTVDWLDGDRGLLGEVRRVLDEHPAPTG